MSTETVTPGGIADMSFEQALDILGTRFVRYQITRSAGYGTAQTWEVFVGSDTHPGKRYEAPTLKMAIRHCLEANGKELPHDNA